MSVLRVSQPHACMRCKAPTSQQRLLQRRAELYHACQHAPIALPLVHAGMFTDPSFQQPTRVDKRGRKVTF